MHTNFGGVDLKLEGVLGVLGVVKIFLEETQFKAYICVSAGILYLYTMHEA